MSYTRPVLDAFAAEFRKSKSSAEGALAQLRDEDFLARLHPDQCSIAQYIQHLAGNMRSRFTNFLTTDGEKPDRNREAEFADRTRSRDELMKLWNDGWAIVFATLADLTDADLARMVTIRTEPHTVALAITRQVAHYAWHVGQIVLLAKHFVTARGDPWTYLTIAPGNSDAFNREKGMR